MKMTKMILNIFVVSLLGTLILAGCADPNGEHRPVTGGSSMGADAAKGELGVSFDRVKPIFANQCQACHPARSAPDWSNFSQAQKYALNGVLFRRVMTEKSMPPPGSPQASAITESERGLIAQWAKSGGPEHAAAGKSGSASAPTSVSDTSSSGTSGRVDAPAEVQQCLQCHTAAPVDAKSKIPRLAGQGAEYIVQQLQRFRWRDRVDPTGVMNDIAGATGMDAATMRKIGEYFAAQPRGANAPAALAANSAAPTAANATSGLSTSAALAAKLNSSQLKVYELGQKLAVENCVQCHMSAKHDGGSANASVPTLAGLPEQYVRNRLMYFREHAATSPLMGEYARLLKNGDIEALALYFSQR